MMYSVFMTIISNQSHHSLNDIRHSNTENNLQPHTNTDCHISIIILPYSFSMVYDIIMMKYRNRFV